MAALPARPRPSLLPALATLLALGGPLAGCGDDAKPVCGNAVKELGEDCDRGAENGKTGVSCSASCRSVSVPIPQVRVSWGLLQHTMIAGYNGAKCSDFGAASAHIVLDGPSPIDQIVTCRAYGQTYSGYCPGQDGGVNCSEHLAVGDYQARITLLDAMGAAVTREVVSVKRNVQAGDSIDLAVDFGMADFHKQDWTGSLQLGLSWGASGRRCATASPAVAKEALWLVREGETTPIAGMTLAGTRLDGTAAACYTPGDGNTAIYEEARNVPWGPYALTVKGFDAANQVRYCGSFTVFIGPSATNQAWSLLVPAATCP